jgi:hypothetical protein
VRYVGNHGTLSSALHHIATRRDGRLKRISESLVGVDGLVAEEEEEEKGGEDATVTGWIEWGWLRLLSCTS